MPADGDISPIPPSVGPRDLSQTFGCLRDILAVPDLARPVLRGEPLEYNEMTCRVTIGRQAVTEHMVNELRCRIEKEYVSRSGKALCFGDVAVWQALGLVASTRAYHPVREYLDGLTWDGIGREAFVVKEVLGAEPVVITKAILRRALVSMVARVYEPGCKVDTMPVLVGNQGSLKSTFWKIMAGKEWFKDTPIDLHSKDAYGQLCGVWLYEWAELETLARARDDKAAKSFLSSAVDDYRPPYGRANVSVPRTSVFVGTTNEVEFLADPTGSRRYWPIATGDPIDLDKLVLFRDQLWAEAVHRFRGREQWHLTREEDALLKPVHDAHRVSDTWEDVLRSYLRDRPGPGPATTRELLVQGIGKRIDQVGRADEMRIGKAMRALGYRSVRPGSGDRTPGWVDVRPRQTSFESGLTPNSEGNQ